MKNGKRVTAIAVACALTFAGTAPAAAQTFMGGTPPECAITMLIGDAHPANKTGYVDDIQNVTLSGEDFRRVLYTGNHVQLVVMTMAPGEEAGPATRVDQDFFVRVEAGQGQVSIDGTVIDITANSGIIVPAGALYKLGNTGPGPMKLSMIYTSPPFASNSVRTTRSEADSMPDAFDGCTTE